MPSGYNPVPFGQGHGAPNRGTSETSLDSWNQQFRQSEIYQSFMRRNGLPTDGRVRLSRSQQSALEAQLRAAGIQIPSGMHIDQGGNLNQKNRLGRNVAIGAAATGAALTGFGLAGMGPLSGLGGGAAGAAGGAGAAGAGGGIGTIAGGAPWAVTPYAGTAMSVPTGAAAVGGTVGAGAGVGAAGGAVAGAGGVAGAEAARTYLGLTPRDWMALGGASLGTVDALTGDPSNLNPNAGTTDPDLQRLIRSMQGRLDKSEPLYDSIMAMADGLLPTRYQRGGRGGGPF